MPKLALAFFMLALVALASTISYAGYLVVSVISEFLGTGRFAAGLLLGVLFARLPLIRQGKLRTVGLLPGPARLPVTVALLALCLLNYLYRGEMLPALILALVASFLLSYRRMRQALLHRAFSSVFGPAAEPVRASDTDRTVTDVDFREKND